MFSCSHHSSFSRQFHVNFIVVAVVKNFKFQFSSLLRRLKLYEWKRNEFSSSCCFNRSLNLSSSLISLFYSYSSADEWVWWVLEGNTNSCQQIYVIACLFLQFPVPPTNFASSIAKNHASCPSFLPLSRNHKKLETIVSSLVFSSP